jgi:hypothetical protein
VLAEPPADDDPVARVVVDLLLHGLHHRAGLDDRSPPVSLFTLGESV